MKKNNSTIILASIILLFGCKMGDGSQSIAVQKSANSYKFTAEYPERKTAAVVKYIETSLSNDSLFATSEEQKNSDINLGDTIKFHLKANQGFVEISFKKTENSETAYKKLEKLCIGIRNELAAR